MTEERLLECTGDHKENPTMSIPAACIFAHGQKEIELTDPVLQVEQETLLLQQEFWSARK